jgi:NAD(P)H-hydrate epimerase
MIMSRSMSHVYEPPVSPPAEPARLPRVLPGPSPLVFDRDSIRAVDRAAIDEHGIPGIVLMENAARGLCDEAMKMLDAAGEISPLVLIICGAGNNGGDGYAMARHLHNRGVDIVLVAIAEPRPDSDAAANAATCRNMDLPVLPSNAVHEFAAANHISLIVDAIFGTGLERPVTGRAAEMIDWINRARPPVLAVDVPSGIDCNTGEALGTAVKATRTVTFVGHKTGFSELHAQKLLGEVVVVDIGAPRELTERFGRRLEPTHPEVPEHEIERGLHMRRPGR